MKRFATLGLVLAGACSNGGAHGKVPGVEVQELSSSVHEDDLPCSSTDDYEDDGVVDETTTYSYEDGGRVETDVYRVGGEVVQTSRYTLDQGGRLISIDDDEGALGRGSYTFIYDSFGRSVRDEEDDGKDGTLDKVTVYTAWTDAGRALAATTTRLDGPTTTMVWSYDADGRLVDGVETQADGTAYRRRTVSYDDAAGTRTTVTSGVETSIAGLNYTRVETFADGHIVSESYVDEMGRATQIVFRYDGQGRVTTIEYHSDMNTQVTRYRYDGC